MKFGKVTNPELIDFTLPADDPLQKKLWKGNNKDKHADFYIGCAKWGRAELKGFYPRGTKDELAYYSTQFNTVELNASFYRIFPPEQFIKWRDKTPDGFRFCPKIPQEISHFKQLNSVTEAVDRFLNSVIHLEEKLGPIFLQLSDKFAPNRFDKIEKFIEDWPRDVDLTLELRHEEWYSNQSAFTEITELLESRQIGHVITDTAGRRDLIHMRNTTNYAFIRYVGANHATDYERLDAWTERIGEWMNQGVSTIYFFIHQNLEQASPLLAAYFAKKLVEKYNLDIQIPSAGNQTFSEGQNSLF